MDIQSILASLDQTQARCARITARLDTTLSRHPVRTGYVDPQSGALYSVEVLHRDGFRPFGADRFHDVEAARQFVRSLEEDGYVARLAVAGEPTL